MTSPTGKNVAPMVLMRPGAFSWYQGAVSVDNVTAQLLQESVLYVLEDAMGQNTPKTESTTIQTTDDVTYPKPSKGPVIKEFQKSLSHRIWAFLHPILETNSVVC